MDDSLMNSSIFSSSVYLKNVEELIKNLEQQTNIISNEDFLLQSLNIPTDTNSFLIPSATSWKQMKKSQRITIIPSNDTSSTSVRSPPLNLYKIFQQKTLSKQSTIHKSLPDLSFICQYSKELPRSQTTSSTINIARMTPSPTLIHQQKHDTDRPRTLKSIKRYKNNKHSTEPLNVFYSPQLRRNPSFASKPSSSTSEDNLRNDSSQFSKQYGEMRRCHTDIITLDPILHSLTDSPPNEFCLQNDDENENFIEQSVINLLPNLDQTVPLIEQMDVPVPDYLVEKINEIIKYLFEIQRSEKIFFLNNENNSQLDYLLKTDLCFAIQNLLEHGRKDQKKINTWKIIQISLEHNTSTKPTPQVYYQAKEFAQNISPYWLYKFQAFIFALLNQNELINWLYYFTRQKDILQQYYQSPQALILVSIASTFNLFERIMTQLEKLTLFKFHLVYRPPCPTQAESISTSIARQSSTKSTAKDWVMTLSRRTTKGFSSNETFRSTLTRKFNAIFTKTNSSSDLTKDSRRPSLNVDKPKSVRYRPRIIPSK